MLRAPPLVPFPTAILLAPMVSVAIPAVRNPIVAVPRRLPVTGHPVMTMAPPAPEATDPDLPDNRRPSDIFHPRRRWRHGDRFAVVVTVIVVRPIGRNDRTAAGDCSSRQQDPQDSVFHSRAFRYCDKLCAINVGSSERPTQPAILYKLLQFPAHARISDEHPEFETDLPAALIGRDSGEGNLAEETVVYAGFCRFLLSLKEAKRTIALQAPQRDLGCSTVRLLVTEFNASTPERV